MSRTVFKSLNTQSRMHFPDLYGFFVNTYCAHCRCCISDFVPLFNLVFHYLLDNRTRQITVIVETLSSRTLLAERVDRFKLFPKPVGTIGKTSSIDHVLLAILCSSQRHCEFGEDLLACCLSHILSPNNKTSLTRSIPV